MRIFKTAWFSRFASKKDIGDDALIVLVKELQGGNFDADLGGGVYKKRLAREGEGKSGGFRTLICFKRNDRAFFVFGFPKSARDNISQGELADLKKLARVIFDMDWNSIENGVASGKFFEVGEDHADIQE